MFMRAADTLCFVKRIAVLILVAALPAYGADDCHVLCIAKREAVRYVRDAKSLAAAPLHWDRKEWTRFGEGSAAVLALYATDRQTSDYVQRHRSSSTDQFARDITPFGGHRALQMSVLMIAAGAGIHDTALRDAGRDSFEAELLAAGVVTPLLKRAFGRARPIQNEGSHSFHPLKSHFESFPSGHATNAFAFATAVAGHYDGWIVPTIVYTIASGVAVSRVNDHVHFPSDVLAGALIGHAVAKGILARHTGTNVSWQAVPLIDRKSVGLMVAIGPARR
jgi:membrane-associated phospholipid phosphatase